MDWNPFADENATSDPYRTLIISNVSYNINEAKLKEHFKMYGPVKTVRIIRNLN
jgi:U1 small nuclear ribonucleoprotein